MPQATPQGPKFLGWEVCIRQSPLCFVRSSMDYVRSFQTVWTFLFLSFCVKNVAPIDRLTSWTLKPWARVANHLSLGATPWGWGPGHTELAKNSCFFLHQIGNTTSNNVDLVQGLPHLYQIRNWQPIFYLVALTWLVSGNFLSRILETSHVNATR